MLRKYMEYVNKKFSNKNKEIKKNFCISNLGYLTHTYIYVYLAYNYLAIEIKKDIF